MKPLQLVGCCMGGLGAALLACGQFMIRTDEAHLALPAFVGSAYAAPVELRQSSKTRVHSADDDVRREPKPAAPPNARREPERRSEPKSAAQPRNIGGSSKTPVSSDQARRPPEPPPVPPRRDIAPPPPPREAPPPPPREPREAPPVQHLTGTSKVPH